MEVQNAKVWGFIPDKDLNLFLSLLFMVRQVTSFFKFSVLHNSSATNLYIFFSLCL